MHAIHAILLRDSLLARNKMEALIQVLNIMITIMPRAEPWAYGSLLTCVCVRNAYLSNHLQLSTEFSNTSRSRYFMKIK